jgi:hypothetical protein
MRHRRRLLRRVLLGARAPPRCEHGARRIGGHRERADLVHHGRRHVRTTALLLDRSDRRRDIVDEHVAEPRRRLLLVRAHRAHAADHLIADADVRVLLIALVELPVEDLTVEALGALDVLGVEVVPDEAVVVHARSMSARRDGLATPAKQNARE